jgi:hypothetical protein
MIGLARDTLHTAARRRDLKLTTIRVWSSARNDFEAEIWETENGACKIIGFLTTQITMLPQPQLRFRRYERFCLTIG